jgi:hypothetical protein
MAQTSGMAPQFSDGVRKTMVGVKAPVRQAAEPKVQRPAPASTHRRGGFAKHARGK